MTLTSESTWANGSKTLVFTIIAANYTFTDGQTTATVTLTDSATACPVVVPCTPERYVTEPLVTNREMFATYTEGSQSNNYEFIDGGVRIWIENGKNAWYHAFNTPLSQIGAPSMDYSSEGGLTPGLQIVIDFNNDGTPDGTLVGESTYGNNWWLTNGSQPYVKAGAPHVGTGNGSPYYGTLDEWLRAFPQAQVKYVGYSLGTAAAGKGVLHSLTFGCHTWMFGKAPREAQSCTAPKQQAIAPIAEGPSASCSFESNGLHLNTPVSDDTVYVIFDAGNTHLQDITTLTYDTLRLATSGGEPHLVPSYFLLVDKDGSTVTTADRGYILYEPYYSYQAGVADEVKTGVWQSWDAIAGGDALWWGPSSIKGSASYTVTWDQIVAMNPNATIVEFGVNQGTGNPELYSVVQDVNFNNCVTITFTKPGQGGGTPVTPTPVVPGNGTTTSTVLPLELPHTGPTEPGSAKALLFALITAVATYGAVYFAQGKRRYE